jgi:hypothetical protein
MAPDAPTLHEAGRCARRLAVLAWAASLAAPLAAQRSDPSTLVALATAAPIRIDGRLDEPAWQQAQRISNFTQRELNFGAPASERTEVAVLFDEDALYIGFWCYDSDPGGIRAPAMARDFSFGSDDNVEIVLDTFDDDRNGYLFVTNPNGARSDALVADNGGVVNRDWDGVWMVRTSRTLEGWFAEFRIPFSTLRFRPGSGQVWGLNLERNIRRKREQVLWQGWSRDYNLEQVSRAGALAGLRPERAARPFDARPFAIGGTEWQRAQGRENVGHAGLDIAWLPSANWKMNLTVNPDFAQVESDREEVNLTRFSLFYPEKRPFFLEGQEFFQFQISDDARPFYSRRIGLAEDRTELQILGGARILGKRAGSTLGALLIRSEEDGAEPASDFAVVRWKQDVLEESAVGVIAVGRHEPGRTNAAYGADLRFATTSFLGEREFEAGLTFAQTFTSDSTDRFGLAHRFFVGYPNDLIDISASWTRVDSNFNPEAGFLRRSGFHQVSSEFVLAPRPAFLPFVQRFEIKPWEFSWYGDDATGDLQSFYAEVVPLAFTLRSGDSFEFNVQRRADVPTEPFELIEDVEIPAGTYWFTRWAADASTYSGRPLRGSVEVSGGDFYTGTRREVALSATWKTNRHIGLGADWARNRLSVAGESLTVDEAGGRIDFAISPDLFGAVAGQWNNEDDEVIVNVRLVWIPFPGSDVYLVFNQLAEHAGSRWLGTRSTAVSKIVWRFAF